MQKRYEATWASLRRHSTPEWLRRDKFGIYTHWGVYSVPACGPNGSWYAHNMYRKGNSQYDFHEKTYGPSSKFGYKDLIPLFRAENFNADEWAEIFKSSGARFAGPVAEHHDGFSMWDSRVNPWNAAKMGPGRDVTGELEKAIRGAGMRFMTAFHHFEQWWFYPHWRSDCDVSEPQYAGLYGPMHNLDGLPGGDYPNQFVEWRQQDRPPESFHQFWRTKIDEVMDAYQPDLMWFDFGLRFIQEDYRKNLLADYYNKEQEWGRELAVTYKGQDLVTGSAIIDYELGSMNRLTYHDWITDTSIDDQGAWSFVSDAGFKKPSTLIHNLIDNVSKNGYLLLNVGPKADGSIPEQAKKCLQAIGDWLQINGEAIFDTVPWVSYGEGPTSMKSDGDFSERNEVHYTPADIRFTARDNQLYATCLGWPTRPFAIKSLKRLYDGEIENVCLLGSEVAVNWSQTINGLEIEPPAEAPCEEAFVFRIDRKSPFQ